MDNRPCAVCDRRDSSYLYWPKRSPGPIVRCRHCGLHYVGSLYDQRAVIEHGPVLGGLDVNVLTSECPDDVAGSWELSEFAVKSADRPALIRNAQDALHRIERHLPPGGGARKLLDFGCGWGFFLAEAKSRGWDTYGLEPLAAHAVYARALSGGQVCTDTLGDETFAPESFDVVTAFQVLEHVPDPGGDLRRLHCALKPGGLLLVEVPNIDTWSVRLLGPRHRHFVEDHLTFFCARTLSLCVERHGFRVLDTYHPTRSMSVQYLLSAWLSRSLPKRGAALLEQFARRLRLGDRCIGLNIGDILTLIARKA